jgi:hypothetical protein
MTQTDLCDHLIHVTSVSKTTTRISRVWTHWSDDIVETCLGELFVHEIERKRKEKANSKAHGNHEIRSTTAKHIGTYSHL